MYVEGQEAGNSMNPGSIYETTPNVEAIEAVALQSSNFAPEFGQIVGGTYNFNVKSGTNSLHGSGFEYFVNEDFDAGLTFTDSGHGHLIRPVERKNDFGFSVGGPIYIPKVYNGKNKSFFFFDWEWYKDSQIHLRRLSDGSDQSHAERQFQRDLDGAQPGHRRYRGGHHGECDLRSGQRALVQWQLRHHSFPGQHHPHEPAQPRSFEDPEFHPRAIQRQLGEQLESEYPNPTSIYIPSIKLDQNLGDKHHISFFFSENHINHLVNTDGLPIPITGDAARV